MKLTSQILLFVFMTFLFAPTIISVLEKSADVSKFYSVSEEEKVHKEVKAVFTIDEPITAVLYSDLKSSLIHSENLSKHDKISAQIFIPPPDQF